MSRLSDPAKCGRACQFIRPDYARLETQAHGRRRDPARGDERFFGVVQDMRRASLAIPRAGAQWSGLTTRIAERLLETGEVEAVLTVRGAADDPWRPEPMLATQASELAEARGMRMGFAPVLALLETALARGYRRIAVIAIPCQAYALRALERELGFDAIRVIGTPCSDNTTTERFHDFLARLTDRPEAVTHLEFMPDYHVEMRFADGGTRRIPFISLPISDLPADFFPTTCRTCVDYCNTLSDITVGYMGGDGEQWILVRNASGARMLELVEPELRTAPLTSAGRRKGPVTGFLANTRRAAGGLPLRRAPKLLRRLIGWLMPRTGPRGLEFARTRVEMKAAETILHLRRLHPRRMRAMVPEHVWALAAPYGLAPEPGETDAPAARRTLIGPRARAGRSDGTDPASTADRTGPAQPDRPRS